VPDLAELRLTVYAFTSPYCTPCQRNKPRVQALANDAKSTDFLEVDISKTRVLMEKWEIKVVPTYVVFYAGEEVFRTNSIYELENLVREFEAPL
jgi:thiol-disulfide isomerase/thioredoxin